MNWTAAARAMCVWENEKIEVNLAWPLGERLARLSSYLFQMNGGFKSGCLKGVCVCVCVCVCVKLDKDGVWVNTV